MFLLSESLRWSPDGCHVETIPAGEHPELPPRAVEIAGQLGILTTDSGPSDDESEQPPKKGKK